VPIAFTASTRNLMFKPDCVKLNVTLRADPATTATVAGPVAVALAAELLIGVA
jgi:hypothetical protein